MNKMLGRPAFGGGPSFRARLLSLGTGSPLCLSAGSTGTALQRTAPVRPGAKDKMNASNMICLIFG